MKITSSRRQNKISRRRQTNNSAVTSAIKPRIVRQPDEDESLYISELADSTDNLIADAGYYANSSIFDDYILFNVYADKVNENVLTSYLQPIEYIIPNWDDLESDAAELSTAILAKLGPDEGITSSEDPYYTASSKYVCPVCGIELDQDEIEYHDHADDDTAFDEDEYDDSGWNSASGLVPDEHTDPTWY